MKLLGLGDRVKDPKTASFKLSCQKYHERISLPLLYRHHNNSTHDYLGLLNTQEHVDCANPVTRSNKATTMASTPRSPSTHPSGQQHDRIEDHHDRDEFFMPDPEENQDVSISIAQKMLSAVSGSVLTSLLVTPLDVVRVRLQSQPHISASRTPTLPTQFSNLPPNLGISQCCREVFWVNNNAAYCVAGPPSVEI